MNKIIEKNEEDNNSQGSNNTLTSNSDNVNENNKRGKKTRNRPSKAERFGEEREKLIKELEKMIGLTEEMRGVLLYDLEHNNELKLRELVPEIKKYYRTCSWGYFSKEEKKGMDNEIGLLKAMYKNEGYNILTKRKTCEYDGKKNYKQNYIL
jgi:hypothetical protein